MPKLTKLSLLLVASLATFDAHATAPVAEYLFNGTLASSDGAAALVATNPLGTSGFNTDTVFGNSQTVYSFRGLASPVDQQAGLSLSTVGLITNNSVYSVEIVFKFTQRANAWRRIIDVQNRQSDNGFYVDPSNNLDVFPVAGGSAFSNDTYHDVFLTVDNGTVKFYLDGSSQATASTGVMNIDSNNNMNFFLDNVIGGGQQEYSDGSVALIRVYNEALSTPPMPVPEPETYAMMLAGLGLLGAFARRRKNLTA